MIRRLPSVLFSLFLGLLIGSLSTASAIGDRVPVSERASAGVATAPQGNVQLIPFGEGLETQVVAGPNHARAHITHTRNGVAIWEGDAINVVPTVGRDQLHLNGYGTTGLATNGFNWVALSNDTLTETTASTTLSTEIVANGLSRAQGAYAHTAGTNTTTITKTFTASGTQSAQKAALFNASTAGTMNHALSFTQRNLISGDTLTVVFTITLG